MQLQDPSNKLSRRNWLRDAAIAATGAAVMPSLLTSCSDHRVTPGVGVGSPQPIVLTNSELRSAAQNLLHMEAWISDVYPYCIEYEVYAYQLLKSGQKPTGWKDFIVDAFITIAAGLLEAAELEIPFVGPAFAISTSFIKTWVSGGARPSGLDASFAEFARGHISTQKAISDRLLTLADETDNYKNLREGWKEELEFNGKKYTLKELANSQFPTKNQGSAYATLRTAAFEKFKKYLWNAMFIKAGTMTYSAYWFKIGSGTPSQYAVQYYRDYPATYLRGFTLGDGNFIDYYYRYWYWEFDGLMLSAEAAKELFRDDYPEHIINPDALFNRDQVFKQFHKEKPDFFGYYDLRKDFKQGPGTGYARYFDENLDFEFTGGLFPELIKK